MGSLKSGIIGGAKVNKINIVPQTANNIIEMIFALALCNLSLLIKV